MVINSWFWCLDTGHVKAGLCGTGINLALSAVNLAEAAGEELATETLAEVYATAAVAIKLHSPGLLQFVAVSITVQLHWTT